MKEQLQNIKATTLAQIAELSDAKTLEDLRIKVLGKKGELTAILKQMGSLSPEERPKMGQLANEVRAEIESAITAKKSALADAALDAKLAAEKIIKVEE